MKSSHSSFARSRPLVHGRTAVYHVISRAAFDQFIFGDREKEVFRRMLWKQASFHGVEVITYCLMSNHVHLLVRIPHEDDVSDATLLKRYRIRYTGPNRPTSAAAPEEIEAILSSDESDAAELRSRLKSRMGDLPVFMRELKQCFGIWYNRTHHNHGTIWAERYKSLIVEDAVEALSAVAAYIDLNPVRAEITDDPGKYRWCGFAEAIGGSSRAQYGLGSVFSGDNRSWQNALPAYRSILFGKGRAKRKKDGKVQGRVLAKAVQEGEGTMGIGEALRHRIRYFRDGMILGSKEFVEAYFSENRQRFGPKRQSGARSMHGADWGGLHVMRDLRTGS